MALSTVSVGQKITAAVMNGVINLINKMLPVQVGTGSIVLASGGPFNTATQARTFGTAFTSAPNVVVMQTSGDAGMSYAATSITTTGFTAQVSCAGTLGIGHTVSYLYVAFGPY